MSDRLQCRIVSTGTGYRVLLGDIDLTKYIGNFAVEVEQDQAEITSFGEMGRRYTPLTQRTIVKLELINLEIVNAGTTDQSKPFTLGGANRKLDLG